MIVKYFVLTLIFLLLVSCSDIHIDQLNADVNELLCECKVISFNTTEGDFDNQYISFEYIDEKNEIMRASILYQKDESGLWVAKNQVI